MRKIRPHIVIAGGGFAGLSCLQALANSQADVTLIDRTDHHLFQPLLYLAGAGAFDPSIIASPLKSLAPRPRKTRIIRDELAGVDRDGQTVTLMGGETLPFDFLVIATGAQTDWRGHDDWARHACDLKTKADSEHLSARLAQLPPRAAIAIVGGGPTGVELAGALTDRQMDRTSPGVPWDADIHLIEGGRDLLPSYRRGSRKAATRALAKRGVRLHLGARVEEMGKQGLQLSGERMAADLIVWAAGVKPVPLADMLQTKVGHDGVLVTKQLTLADRGPAADRIFVVGDSADFSLAGAVLPKLAPAAKEMGQFAGRVIAARARGLQPPRKFRFSSPGQMAVIAQGEAVAELGPVSLTGEAAWAMWLAVHLAFLPGNDKRLRAFARVARLPQRPQIIRSDPVLRLASPRSLKLAS